MMITERTKRSIPLKEGDAKRRILCLQKGGSSPSLHSPCMQALSAPTNVCQFQVGSKELMPKTIANATVDRLLHRAHVVVTTGDSIRLTQATCGRGVKPLKV